MATSRAADGERKPRPLTRTGADRRVVRAVGFVPVEAKLREPPAGRDASVERGELVDRLRESAGVPVVLLTAPAGYGKTTLLRQWAEEDPRPFAWLTLDAADNDPVVMVTYLLLALHPIEPFDPGTLMSLTGGRVTVGTEMLPRLGRVLRGRKRPLVLVLDDADVLTEPDALAVVTTLIAHLPEGSQIAIAAREPPKLPWHTLRVEGRLVALTASDLEFTPAETRELLAEAGLDLSADDLASLHDLTEGWAAGVYLAAQSLLASAERHPSVTTMARDDTGVLDYLREELLSSLTQAEQTFLLRISLLDRMCGPLCDAVLSTTGSGEVLQKLRRSSMFIVPLDNEDVWYRLHHLFRDLLRAEQQRREPRLARQMHSRASRWYEDFGDIERAIDHAHAAGEIDHAARLIWTETAGLLSRDVGAVLEAQINKFTSEQVISRTHLALASAWLAVERGGPVKHWASAAERGTYDDPNDKASDELAAAVALLRAAQATHGVTQMTVDAELALRLQSADDPWRSLALFFQGAGMHLAGRRESALQVLEEAEHLSSTLDLHVPRALALTQLAVLALEENDWPSCESRVDLATTVLQEHGLADVPLAGLPRCMATLVLAKRGLAAAATRESRRSLAMLAATGPIAPWLAVECRYLLARAHTTFGDTAAARVLLSEAQALLSATADATVLHRLLDLEWQNLEESPLGQGVAFFTLTTAELRVLQYLPTHLSFEQISQRLFVSRNTVKSQAIAAYRKLGVTSRSEAVERALSLGLVPPSPSASAAEHTIPKPRLDAD